VLLVDDQRQVTRMLRSSLELSGRGYEILDAPSAEEALREMERGPIDLVVTDLRLPEMTGLELIARIRQIHPRMRAILVTGQPTRQVEAQARALGVVAFIPKPVSTTLFLQAVDRALAPDGQPETPITGDKARAAERLMTMQRELGARAARLVALSDGRPLLHAGEDDEQVEQALARAVEALALSLRDAAPTSRPAHFLYLDADPQHVFLTNVGRDRALAIGFAVRQEAWQMGAIFHYARRVVDELGEILAVMEPGLSDEPEPVPAPEPGAPPEGRSAADEPPTTPRAVQEFWDEAARSAAGQAPRQEGALSYEQARQLGLIPDDSTS